MPTVNLSPVFNVPTVQDTDGFPLSGGMIFTYEAGSNSLLKETYTSTTGDVPNSNPIVLDSSGTLPNAIWLIAGEAYNLVLTRDDSTTVIKGFDDVMGIPPPPTTGGGGGDTATTTIWVNVPDGSYLSPTQFLLPGNFAGEFKVGNRARLTLSSGFRYGTVSAVAFSNPNTTVTILNDSSPLDSSLSAADYSILIASAGSTVDAGGVSYFDAMPYITSNTVGWKIKTMTGEINASIDVVHNEFLRSEKVWPTTGGGAVAYVISPTPAISDYISNAIWVVKFNLASTVTPLLGINALPPKTIFAYDSNGNTQPATIKHGCVYQVAYDDSVGGFILLDQLPQNITTPPHGQQVIDTNATFVVPANVFSVKVTAVGGGGGGGGGHTVVTGDIEAGFVYLNYYGGAGGDGGAAIKYLNVTPTQNFAVTIGTNGNGSKTTGTPGGTTTFGPSLVVGTGGGAGSVSTAGNPGFGSVADYSFFSVGFQVGTARKGVGGVGGYGDNSSGTNGAPGLCIIEW